VGTRITCAADSFETKQMKPTLSTLYSLDFFFVQRISLIVEWNSIAEQLARTNQSKSVSNTCYLILGIKPDDNKSSE